MQRVPTARMQAPHEYWKPLALVLETPPKLDEERVPLEQSSSQSGYAPLPALQNYIKHVKKKLNNDLALVLTVEVHT